MDKALFERLTHSMAQMNEIIEGRLCCERLPMIRNMCCKHLTVRGMVMPYRKH